jgi:hypothetical protein
MLRHAKWILLFLLFVLVSCQQIDAQRAEQTARWYMVQNIGIRAVLRAHVEVRPSKVGWMVIFRDAYASCDEGISFIGACRFAPTVYKDVYACVPQDWTIRGVGATKEPVSVGAEDVCQQFG